MLKIKISEKQGYYFVIFLQKITHLEFMMKDSWLNIFLGWKVLKSGKDHEISCIDDNDYFEKRMLVKGIKILELRKGMELLRVCA